ncbi:MAG: hypothetical protein C4538_04385 [Nitrospiraceae bacterium]|nr:MAG: hypothetical protein C4538_04385 [Nitrospiraceae bacterium]
MKEQNNIWIISEGKMADLDLSGICEQDASKRVTEYQISELARYLLNPNPISVEEKVVGCRIKYRPHHSGLIDRLKNRFFPKKTAPSEKEDALTEEIISASRIGFPSFQDDDLNRHFIKINELLRQYDPAHKKIAALDRENIEDVTAVCEDIGGNRYQLNLQGNTGEKINYVMNSISKRVNVVFNKAYLSMGLFEMRGFRFPLYNPHTNYRLIKYLQNNQARYCVLNGNYQLEYPVNDHELVNYMHIFEQSIRTDPKLNESLTLCTRGEGKPLKLFFSTKLDQSYTEKHLPMTYRKIFDMYKMNLTEKAAVANMLNNNQRIVSFNYVPRSESGRQKLCINISVLHDIKALEPIRSRLPQLYSEINQKAPSSDIGRLYLLDSMRGFQYV